MSQPLNYPSPQAPVDILPGSILSDIFLHVKSASTHWDHQIRTPFTLATVSRRWRTIALSTSRLWDYVDGFLPTERAMAHLTRSRHVPMRVWLDIFRAYTPDRATLTNIFHTLGTNIWTHARDLIVLLDYKHPSFSHCRTSTNAPSPEEKPKAKPKPKVKAVPEPEPEPEPVPEPEPEPEPVDGDKSDLSNPDEGNTDEGPVCTTSKRGTSGTQAGANKQGAKAGTGSNGKAVGKGKAVAEGECTGKGKYVTKGRDAEAMQVQQGRRCKASRLLR
ncbi:hypothetical protein FRC08_018921 [Ceratobasidium sp. 394]|nr:hypothetical protein FRC08_018921 [Ceratobasidium sp. 394]